VGRKDLHKRVGMFHLLFIDHTVAGDEVKRLFYLQDEYAFSSFPPLHVLLEKIHILSIPGAPNMCTRAWVSQTSLLI